MVAHYGRCRGSLLRCGGSLWDTWWLIIGYVWIIIEDVVDYTVFEMYWLIIGDVVAHYFSCGGSLREMWWFSIVDGWLTIGHVVAHYWRCGGSLF